MAPSTKVEVAVEALITDAGRWEGWAAELDAAAGVAAGLTLTANDLCVLSESLGLPALYSGLQQAAQDRARAGAQAFYDVAHALRQAANYYDTSDANAVQRLGPR
jgi:hypothetical protein